VPSEALPPQAKITGSYVNVALAVDEARSAGFDDAILMNMRGTVAEASTSNVFSVSNGVLSTPSRDSDILPGITRACVLELAKGSLGVEVRELPLLVPDLLSSDEVFLSGTGCELVSVTSIGGRPIGTGRPGPVTAQLSTSTRPRYAEAMARTRTGSLPSPSNTSRAITDQGDPQCPPLPHPSSI
jgi:branched-chain amino acid aminotransferase